MSFHLRLRKISKACEKVSAALTKISLFNLTKMFGCYLDPLLQQHLIIL